MIAMQKSNRDFSTQIINKLRNVFVDCFPINDSALYSWGSTSRREMGKNSDLDLFIIYNGKDIHKRINRFLSIVQSEFPNNKIDLLQKYTVSELIRIAKIDGGDRQAITLSRLETDNNSLSEELSNKSREILEDRYDKTRELIYIMITLKRVYPFIFPGNDIKFGDNGLRYLNYAFLFCRYIFEETENILDTQSALRKLKEEGVISGKLCDECINASNFLFSLRNNLPIMAGINGNLLYMPQAALNKEDNSFENIYLNEFYAQKKVIKSLLDFLFPKTMELLVNELGREETEVLDNLISGNSEKIGEDFEFLTSEIKSMVVSYCSSEKRIHEQLYEKYEQNWYVLFGIANNRMAESSILNRLVNPLGKSKKILRLHQGFAWRNMYLYVARNPASNLETLNIIKNYKNAREMDIEAANASIYKKREK